jgi:hypothetical protein
MARSLEVDEAMLDRHDRHEIFISFVDQHLFSEMPDDEFLRGMQERLRAAERATDRLLGLLKRTG